MNRCPYCRKPLESLGTGVARVIDARVVVYCSAGCLQKARRGSPWSRGLLLATGASSVMAQQAARALATLVFPVERAVLALSVVLLATGAGSLALWMMDPGPRPSFEPFRSLATQARWTGAQESVEPTAPEVASGGAPEVVRMDPIEANGRALEVLEASLTVEQPSLWDMDALAVLAAHRHEKAAARLLLLARGQTGPVRRKAAAALARIGRPEGVDVLREDLMSQNNSNASMAAIELGRLGDRTALPVLKRLIDYSETRMAAAEAALHLNYEPAKILLMQTVRFSTRPGDRVRAAVALASVGEKQVRELLVQLYEDGQFRFMAAVGLGHLGDTRVLPVLRSALANTALRQEAAQLLLAFSQQDAYRDVVRDLESDHEPTRISAAVAVYMLTAPAAPAGTGPTVARPGEGAANG